MPPEMEAKGFVVAKKLLPYLGYIRILGGMDDNTKAAFSDAMLRVKDTRALILDCRGMGGGGDGPAWEMAGRFFTRNIPFKHDPVLKPSGEWQYEAPVVMLTDERMVSSAETFTWAMAETLRAITVGRPTGGATIIPRSFEVPSGIFKFRLGCRDRETSVNGVHPEGKGTAPKVYVPYDAELLTRFQDPILAAGFDVALMLALGAPRSVAVETYGGILGADSQRVQRAQAEWRGYPKSEDLLIDDLDAGPRRRDGAHAGECARGGGKHAARRHRRQQPTRFPQADRAHPRAREDARDGRRRSSVPSRRRRTRKRPSAP